MKFEKRKNLIGIRTAIAAVIMMILFIPLHIEAEETSEGKFINGTNKWKLTDTKTIQVVNDEVESEIAIVEDDKEIFKKELAGMKVASIEKLMVDNQQYGIVTYRFNGSSNALVFEVLKLDKSQAKSIYTSDVYERARIDMKDKEIVLDYPEYEAADVMTEPSRIVTQKFIISGEKVTEGSKDIQKIGASKNTAKLAKNGENPSYAEINKMLTEEALKAGISPEILKAIAFQESSWQQYWTTVPDRIKECKKDTKKGTLDYDGTNVKLGYDCIGIGLMQISDHMNMAEGKEKDAYIDRLKNDIRFNIQEGIKILKEKWNYSKSDIIPTINDNDPMIIENWYFAIMAYNGMLPRNNPLDNAYTAYQEKVFQRLEDYSLIELNPFPTYKLEPYKIENGQLRFQNKNVTVEGPQHLSSQSLKKGDTAYVTGNSVNVRSTPGGKVIGSLKKGTKVTVTGKYEGAGSWSSQYVWIPIKAGTTTGWIASSYLNPTNNYIDVFPLYGDTRYETAVSVANHGWHWQQPNSVVIGRGDLPIDALTGSVLASKLDAPLLLTQINKLTPSVEKELDRLKPKKIYILGGDETAISPSVENKLKKKFGKGNVKRIKGKTRFETAYEIANEIKSSKQIDEIFVTTGDDKSSDALAIAPYAGKKNIPILLTATNKINENITKFIRDNGVKKVTIIGGKKAVSTSVESSLKKLVGSKNVERVEGSDRWSTSVAIVDKYYSPETLSKLFVSRGLETADALAAAPLGSKLNAPLILTTPNKVTPEVATWLDKKVKAKPNLYFLGGPKAITEKTRNTILKLVK